MNQKKQKTLQNLQQTYCRVRPSRLDGVGVFAIRNISKGIKVFEGVYEQKWHRFHMSELQDLDQEILKMIDDFFVIEKDQTVSIPEFALNGIDISFFMNHSNTPKCETIDNGYTFVSLRKIKKGEELTVSYGTYDYKYQK